MLLSKIITQPERFQFRDRPFSPQTVSSIVTEGIDPAKFDPLPLLRVDDGKYCIAGDGHSRLEAVRLLADQGRLPKGWKAKSRRADFEIPSRIVSESDARLLAWTANLSRDNFTPSEEAKVYQSMIDSGLTNEQVAEVAHTSAIHVAKMLTLNSLAHDIRKMVGASPAAGGIDVLTGQVLANGFARYGVAPQQQQQLWHCVLKHAMLNFQSAKKFVDRIGSRLAEKCSDGMLFEMPANAVTVIAEAKARGQAARTAKTGLSLLISAAGQGGLDDFPDLLAFVDSRGVELVQELSRRVTEDADVLADLVAPPKQWEPRPDTAADRRMRKQYDPEATPLLIA